MIKVFFFQNDLIFSSKKNLENLDCHHVLIVAFNFLVMNHQRKNNVFIVCKLIQSKSDCEIPENDQIFSLPIIE